MDKSAIILFVKSPEISKVKTRLAAEIGAHGALQVYKYLSSNIRSVVSHLPLIRQVYYADAIIRNDDWPAEHFEKYQQRGDDIGERMHAAFVDSFLRGAERAVLIGTDIMGLTAPIINRAFQLLDKDDVVLGPANDGGYYLIGMKAPAINAFEGISWSTPLVMEQTVQKLSEQNKSINYVPTLIDIDTYADLIVAGIDPEIWQA